MSRGRTALIAEHLQKSVKILGRSPSDVFCITFRTFTEKLLKILQSEFPAATTVRIGGGRKAGARVELTGTVAQLAPLEAWIERHQNESDALRGINDRGEFIPFEYRCWVGFEAWSLALGIKLSSIRVERNGRLQLWAQVAKDPAPGKTRGFATLQLTGCRVNSETGAEIPFVFEEESTENREKARQVILSSLGYAGMSTGFRGEGIELVEGTPKDQKKRKRRI